MYCKTLELQRIAESFVQHTEKMIPLFFAILTLHGQITLNSVRGENYEECVRTAENREEWRSIAVNLLGTDAPHDDDRTLNSFDFQFALFIFH